MTLDIVPEDESDDSAVTLKADDSHNASTSEPGNHPMQAKRPTQYNEQWKDHFEFKRQIKVSSSATLSFNAFYTAPKGHDQILFVMHHGAGSSALTFAAMVDELYRLNPEAGFLAFDARGHGDTSRSEPDPQDLSLNNLCADFHDVLDSLLTSEFSGTLPSLVLIGHSMGGAVVAHIAAKNLFKTVIGLIVIDVVEGSAIEALKDMQKYLISRPRTFFNIEAAVEWHISSRTVRNSRSAEISVPALLKKSKSSDEEQYTWKTDLMETQQYWESWFTNLSKTFLAAKCGKQLILAGTDRLDKTLMIGQMTGAYQLLVVPESGHFVQEDCPERIAQSISDFCARYQKSSEIIKAAQRRFA